MKRITLTQGAYRYRPEGEKSAVVVQLGDPPFILPDAEAARLVTLGVAQYALPEVATAPQEDDDQAKGENTPPPDGGGKGQETPQTDKPEYGDFMTVAQLKAYADERGIEYEDKTTKAKLIEAIDAFHREYVDDGEQPPALTVQDPVQ